MMFCMLLVLTCVYNSVSIAALFCVLSGYTLLKSLPLIVKRFRIVVIQSSILNLPILNLVFLISTTFALPIFEK
jgi:hypothetical protein